MVIIRKGDAYALPVLIKSDDTAITAADVSGVTDIGTYAFASCCNLAQITLPSSVTSIGAYAFQNCYSSAFYDFTACTAVPTLASTNAFASLPADCEIRVPAALLDEWKAATNWATYANQIVGV